MCPLVPVAPYFLSDFLTQFESIPRLAAQDIVQSCTACESSYGQGLQYRERLSKPTCSCSPEALWKYKHNVQTIFSQKKRVKLTAFSCGCCKRQSFQTGLVWNTEKLNPSQGKGKRNSSTCTTA